MFIVTTEEKEALATLGQRLMARRIGRNESQSVFAARIGISIPTYRRMESGDPSTPMGYWIRALRLLNELASADEWFRETLFARSDRDKGLARRRARRRSP